MNDIVKYKSRIIRNLILLLILVVISIFIVIAAAKELKADSFAILILVLLLVELPVIINLSFSGIRAINIILDNEEKQLSSNEEIEKMEQEVEEKVKEADVLSFNFSRLKEDMPEYSDIETFGQSLLSGISKQVEIVLGVFYCYNAEHEVFKLCSNFAYYSDNVPNDFKIGEGLNGQVVKDKKAMYLKDLPEGYVEVISGLGSSKPSNLLILPLIDKDKVLGLIELATFKPIDKGVINRTKEISEYIGSLIGKIA
ncbi:MAG: GAF domain-containing protein [Salinivirgaceae bacterium]|nr:GAF domain-containing protein [Salinivirgaceae bacterium]